MERASLTIEEWDVQFTRQARWTRAVRSQLYRRVNLLRAKTLLDVGCGTGVVTEELAERTKGQVIGIDIDPNMIRAARAKGGRADYQVGDAHHLSFPEAHFDVVICHFLLLWVKDPALTLRQMARATKPGGAVLACAEPDYGGRVDYPESLPLGRLQAEALRHEGADPFIGRRLRALFAQAGLSVQVGVVPSLWDVETLRAEFEAEWTLMERTLAGVISEEELRRYKEMDRAAIEDGTRLAFMPIFYALGHKPNWRGSGY